jgi:ketosteroid isomerase-like protein
VLLQSDVRLDGRMPSLTPEVADEGWLAALLARDTADVVNFLHDDYALVLVHPAPATLGRAGWLKTLPDYVISRWNVRHSIWDVEPDVATHLQLIEMEAVVLGVERNGPFVITDIWLRSHDGDWRVWRRHSTPLAAGAIPRHT